MATHTITVSWSRAGEAVSNSVATTASGEVTIDEDIAANQTNFQINCAIDVSALKSLMIVADEACTVETNNGTTPDDTLTLLADTPLFWYTGCGHDNPLTVDVTALYVTNTTACNLQVYALQDATP